MNRVQLIGNLGKDPEIKSTSSGNSFAKFSIATSERWKDKSTGEKKEKTSWHNVVCWNEHLTKIIEQYVSKGSKVFVEGKLETRKWQDGDGNDRYSTEVVMQGFDAKLLMLDGKKDGGRKEERDPEGPPDGAGQGHGEDFDDEVPF